MISKLSWRIMQGRDQLWARVLCHKYKLDSRAWLGSLSTNGGNLSAIWQGIVRAYNDFISPNLCWNVTNGRNTNFWFDKWLFEDDLATHCLTEVTITDHKLKVCDLWMPGSGRSWETLHGKLSTSCLLRLASVALLDDWSKPDHVKWLEDPSGSFSASSAYTAIVTRRNPSMDAHGIFDCIWRLRVPERVRFFSWTVCRGKTLTNVERHRRHLAEDMFCTACQIAPETLIHLFHDCTLARPIWESLVPRTAQALLFSMPWDEWYSCNLIVRSIDEDEMEWNTLFVITLWWM